MELWDLRGAVVVVAAVALSLLFAFKETEGVRFSVDREECLSQNVEYEGDTVHASFVVIKTDSQWHYVDDGVDLVVFLLSSSHFLLSFFFNFFKLPVFHCMLDFTVIYSLIF